MSSTMTPLQASRRIRNIMLTNFGFDPIATIWDMLRKSNDLEFPVLRVNEVKTSQCWVAAPVARKPQGWIRCLYLKSDPVEWDLLVRKYYSVVELVQESGNNVYVVDYRVTMPRMIAKTSARHIPSHLLEQMDRLACRFYARKD